VLASAALATLAVGVWALELRRRASGREEHTRSGSLRGRLLQTGRSGLGLLLLPETAGLLLCLTLAGAMLLRGGNKGVPSEDHEVWQEIRTQWPLLTTADSLLGLQTMLRAVLLTSAVLRAGEALRSSVAGEPATLLFLAAAARVALLALSPQDVYHLDGPLGGVTHVLLEVASLGPLAFLAGGRGCVAGRGSSRGLMLTATAAFMAGRLSGAHHLAVADSKDSHLDMLFSFMVLLELAAAAAFLARTVRSMADTGPRSTFATFAHLVLPLQQLLLAYFLLTAWGGAPLEEVPELVGAGRPFEVLQLASVAQVGLYLLAVFAYFIGGEEEKDCGPHVAV